MLTLVDIGSADIGHRGLIRTTYGPMYPFLGLGLLFIRGICLHVYDRIDPCVQYHSIRLIAHLCTVVALTQPVHQQHGGKLALLKQPGRCAHSRLVFPTVWCRQTALTAVSGAYSPGLWVSLVHLLLLLLRRRRRLCEMARW
jgi:hypothetical protein